MIVGQVGELEHIIAENKIRILQNQPQLEI
jgi:hypothetical protein